MTVSVIIPTYNAAEFLPEALESVLSQGEAVSEVIVVDGGSTDATPALMERYEDRVQYVRAGRLSAGGARNLGISLAGGEYVAFLDADDYWLPNKIDLQLAFFRDHPEAEMVFTDVEVFQGKKIILKSLKSDPLYSRVIGNAPILDDPFLKIMRDAFISMGSVMVKRDCLKRVGLFDPALPVAEDRDLWLRIASDAKIGFLPSVLMRVRKHEKNISHDPIRGLQCEIQVIKKQLLTSSKHRSETRGQLADLYERLAHFHLTRREPLEGRAVFREALRYRSGLRPAAYYLSSFAPPLWSLLSMIKGEKPDDPGSISAKAKRRLHRLMKSCYSRTDYYQTELDLTSWRSRYSRGSGTDVEQITSYNLERFQNAFFEEGKAMLADCLTPGYTGFALLIEGRVAGYIRFGVGQIYLREIGLQVELKQRETLIHGLYILPEYRGKRAVGVLFEKGLLFFKERGYQKVFGQIERENLPCLKLVEHIGFKRTALMRSRQVFSRFLKHRKQATA